ncbi:hypothetical protein [Ekhidna sp. To15]|uniref:hypothetical protein n=1 Tax=Ekhidna sp. To15 TaxID=3395267 RepID=UPI003F5239F9
MALNQLAEKLDQVSEHELGFEFDESAVWDKLEQRLDNRKAFVYWWTIAACLLVAFTILPISLLKETNIQTPTVSDQVKILSNKVPVFTAPEKENIIAPAGKEIRVLAKKGLDGIQLAQVSPVELILKPITVSKEKKQKPAFAAKDISVIQASLERPKIEKEQIVTVRAQLHTSTQPRQFNDQVFKIKLFEGSNN